MTKDEKAELVPREEEYFPRLLSEFFRGFPLGTEYRHFLEPFRQLERQLGEFYRSKETEKSYVVKVELPGVKKESIALHLSDTGLEVRVNQETKSKKDDQNSAQEGTRHSRFSGSYFYSLPMHKVDKDAVEAKYEDGLLEVTLPKKEGAKPHQIKIK